MTRAWHLKSRPEGLPTADNFDLREVDLLKVGLGQLRVKNLWLSVDPYMRGRMNDVKSYVPPFALDAPMEGGAIGEVVESQADGFAKGDHVLHMAGWRDEAVIDAKGILKLPDVGAAPEQFLGILGVTGATAYFGLLDAASAKEGDTVFVSAAAGAVGSAVVQIAKAKGMTVIGSAGGPKNARWSARSAPTRWSITARGRCSRGWPRRSRRSARTGSTSISTMSGATISTPLSRSPTRTRGSRSAG